MWYAFGILLAIFAPPVGWFLVLFYVLSLIDKER